MKNKNKLPNECRRHTTIGLHKYRKHSVIAGKFDELTQPNPSKSLLTSNDVISTLLCLDETKYLRKRQEILDDLEECKLRITGALEFANETADDIPWHHTNKPVNDTDHANTFNFMPDIQPDEDESLKKKAKQSAILSTISQYTQSLKTRSADMRELVEWMADFSFQVTWDDVGVKAIEERESEECDAFRRLVLALQRAWQCTKKLSQLTDLLASDDTYDVISGKVPPHIAVVRKKKNVETTRLWCSYKLRNKFDQFEKLRSESTISSENVSSSDGQSRSNMCKEVKGIILREVSKSWKDACLDVQYYMKAVMLHRFTKPSCHNRLKRGLLVMEFIVAAMEGKQADAERTNLMLKEAQATITNMQDEAVLLQREISESQKLLQAARRKITKLKRQVESVNKENENLLAKIGAFHDQVANLEKEIEELQELPDKSEFEDCKARLEELEEEFADLEEAMEDLKTTLSLKAKESESLKQKLSDEKEITSNLAQEVLTMEAENEKVRSHFQELENKVSAQESNIMSLRLMVYYKDEVIRRLKQAAIELKTNEKLQKSPKKPPPSPEERESKSPVSIDEMESPSGETAKISERIKTPEKVKEEATKTTDETREKEDKSSKPSVTRSPLLVSKRLTQGRTPRPPPPPTKVFRRNDVNDAMLSEKIEIQQRLEMTEKQLQTINKKHHVKLKAAVEQQKHKSVFEKMKVEEDLQNLCFSVRDETMRVQKEMRKFNDSISKQLSLLIGLKGNVFNEGTISKNRRSGGLLTLNNISDERQYSDDIPSGMLQEQTMPQDNLHGLPNISMSRMLQDFPGGAVGGTSGAMMGSPDVTNNMLPTSNMRSGVDNNDEILKQDNVDYWKSLRSALGVKTDQSTVAQSPTQNKPNPIAAKVLAEKQQRMANALDTKQTSADSSAKNEANLNPQVSKGKASPPEQYDGYNVYYEDHFHYNIQPSAGSVQPEEELSKFDQNSSNITVQNKTNEQCKSSDKGSNVCELPVFRISDSCPNKSDSTNPSSSKIISVKDSTETIENSNRNVTFNLSPTTHLTVVDRHKARLGERRRSSVASAFHDVMQIARRQSIRPAPPPRVVKFRGFFSELGGNRAFPSMSNLAKKRNSISHEAAVRKKKMQLEEEREAKRKARRVALAATTGIPDDPLKQADMFVRNISKQVGSFFSNMDKSLIDAIKRDKRKMSLQLEEMEKQLNSKRMIVESIISQAKKDKKAAAIELNNARNVINNLLSGKIQSQHSSILNNLESTASLPNKQSVLKYSEDETNIAQQKLMETTKKCNNFAAEYENKSKQVDYKLQEMERAKNKAEVCLRNQKEEIKVLKLQLHELRQCQTQKLFMKLNDHKINYEEISANVDVDDDVKQVVLSLLRRSMLYPSYDFIRLVRRYRQHVELTNCIDKLDCKLNTTKLSMQQTRRTCANKQDQYERVIMQTFLSRLKTQRDKNNLKWEIKKNQLMHDRQKILLKLSLLFQKLHDDKGNVKLLQPHILQITGKGRERLHNNSPVDGQCQNLQLILSKCSYTSLGSHPSQLISTSTSDCIATTCDNSKRHHEDSFNVVGRQPPYNYRMGLEPHWHQNDSLICPFQNRSGRIAPVNSHVDIYHAKSTSAKNQYTPERSKCQYRIRSHQSSIETTRMFEVDVQARLRQAKHIIMNRLCKDKYKMNNHDKSRLQLDDYQKLHQQGNI